jgi:hypothetical protein
VHSQLTLARLASSPRSRTSLSVVRPATTLVILATVNLRDRATMTMDTYGHLFENRLDEVADALERARQQPAQRAAPGAPEQANQTGMCGR